MNIYSFYSNLTDFGGVNNILQNPAVDRITGKAQITSV